MKHQQEDSQNFTSDDVWGPKYKIVSERYSKQEQQLQLPHPHDPLILQRQYAGPCTTPQSLDPRCRTSTFHVAFHGDQGDPTATSRLLHILRKWRMQCRKPNRPAQPVQRAPQFPTRSASCSILNLVPLSCITFSTSSFQLEQLSDHLEDGDGYTDDSHHMNVRSDSNPADAKRQPSPVRSHHHSPTSPHAAGSICKPAPTKIKSSTDCLSEEREHASPCEKKLRAPARRALSCPKLGSPLIRSCTAFADTQEEELECLKPNNEEEDDDQRHNILRRTSSSPSPRRSKKLSTVPKGYLALYVGQERRRFLVKANVLNHPLFSILLEKAKEEFGFAQKGPLTIPCDVPFFQRIMFLVESKDPSCKNVDHSSV